LVATSAAAKLLHKSLTAHLFWEPVSPGVLDNLASTALAATTLRFHGSRLALGLQAPHTLLTHRWGNAAVIPPGGTTPLAMLGHVRAALELALLVLQGQIPQPDGLCVSFGSGGTAVGLAAGLALAGLPTTVTGVLAVERIYAGPLRVRSLVRGLQVLLQEAGLNLPPLHLRLDASAVGPGYGIPTPASMAQMVRWQEAGVPVEPIYTGKALDALQRSGIQGQKVLFWQTARRALPQAAEGWQKLLPPNLHHRLFRQPPVARRRWLLFGAGALGLTAALARSTGYNLALPRGEAWRGLVLSEREAVVLQAAVLALLPPAPLDPQVAAGAVRGIDLYLSHLPTSLQRDIHLLLLAVEQGTLMTGHLRRFSHLEPTERAAALARVGQWGRLGADIANGLRDLAMLGYYQQPAVWPAIGYSGPQMPAEDRPLPAELSALVAAPGQIPGKLKS
jgi:D-cysteine desulfhydrase